MTPAQLSALHFDCFQTPRPWSTKEFADLIRDPAVILCVAESGFALGRVTLDEAELLTIAVSPDSRCQGVGRRLMTDFEAVAKKNGASRVFLEVAASNAAAIRLYSDVGYCETGRRSAYYRHADGTFDDACIYAHELG